METTKSIKSQSSKTFLLEIQKVLADYIKQADQCDNLYPVITKMLYSTFNGAQMEVLLQLIMHGPVWDGDIVSKTARDDLIEFGLVSRACVKGEQGYTVANYRGWDVLKHKAH